MMRMVKHELNPTEILKRRSVSVCLVAREVVQHARGLVRLPRSAPPLNGWEKPEICIGCELGPAPEILLLLRPDLPDLVLGPNHDPPQALW